jgi:NAD(P)-dependent dehydrogenase (short-subunit alcohol dehydrogenase family)
MKAVVVGASSGLGRSVAIGLGGRGAEVALLARRHDRLVDAAREAGEGSLAIACDVTDSASCRAAIEEAVDGLNGIDALLYAPGVATLARLVDTDVDTWRRTFDTNVIGAALITAAAIPHLTASHGVAAYLSSVNGSITAPWPGLGSYAVSKVALETLVEAFRVEHPGVGFTRITVGDCAGGDGASMTEFINSWDMDLLMEMYPEWEARKLLAGSQFDVAELVEVVDLVLHRGATATIPSIVITPRAPAG